MEENYKVSVVIPIYNAVLFLKTCLESIISQSYKTLEILLIDDGSVDGSATICDMFAEKDCRIKVVHKTNQGVSKARNYGLDICSGDFVIFVDSDDWLEPEAIKMLMEIYLSSRADLIVASNYDITYNSNRRFSRVFPNSNWTVGDILENLPFICEKLNVPWGKLYKADLIQRNCIKFNEEIPYGEDTIFNLDYLMCTESVTLSSNIIYNYNQTNEAAANKKFYSEFYLYMIACNNKVKELLSRLSSSDISTNIYEKCALRFFDMIIWHYTNGHNLNFCDKEKITDGLTNTFKYFRKEISWKGYLNKFGLLKTILFKFTNGSIFFGFLKVKKIIKNRLFIRGKYSDLCEK